MRIPFRQGIIRYQTDNATGVPNPTFLQPTNGGGAIDLMVSPDPTIFTVAHGPDTDYLFEERLSIPKAWKGPFISGISYWLYWDIDQLTGKRSFGHTLVEPVFGPTIPTSISPDLHWFDTAKKIMKVYTNGVFVEKIRLFAGEYRGGAIIEANLLGSQVGMNNTIDAGFILYDDEGNPVRKVKNKRASKFVTTESNFSTHASNATVVRLEAQVETARAVDNIAAYQCISYEGPNEIGYASHLNTDREIIGVIREDLYVGEVGTFVTQGFIRNPMWNWTQPTNTVLYSDDTGQLTTVIPQIGSFQKVATIVNPTTILVDIGQQIILDYNVPLVTPPTPPVVSAPVPIEIFDEQPVTNLSGETGNKFIYYIDVPESVMDITFDLFANINDAELFVSYEEIPDPDIGQFQYQSFGETIYRAEPIAGRYYMVIVTYESFANASLEVQYRLNSEA